MRDPALDAGVQRITEQVPTELAVMISLGVDGQRDAKVKRMHALP